MERELLCLLCFLFALVVITIFILSCCRKKMEEKKKTASVRCKKKKTEEGVKHKPSILKEDSPQVIVGSVDGCAKHQTESTNNKSQISRSKRRRLRKRLVPNQVLKIEEHCVPLLELAHLEENGTEKYSSGGELQSLKTNLLQDPTGIEEDKGGGKISGMSTPPKGGGKSPMSPLKEGTKGKSPPHMANPAEQEVRKPSKPTVKKVTVKEGQTLKERCLDVVDGAAPDRGLTAYMLDRGLAGKLGLADSLEKTVLFEDIPILSSTVKMDSSSSKGLADQEARKRVKSTEKKVAAKKGQAPEDSLINVNQNSIVCTLDKSCADELGLDDSLGKTVPAGDNSASCHLVEKVSSPGVQDRSKNPTEREVKKQETDALKKEQSPEDGRIDVAAGEVTTPVHSAGLTACSLEQSFTDKCGEVASLQEAVPDKILCKKDSSPDVEDRSKVLSEREARKQAKQAAKKAAAKKSQTTEDVVREVATPDNAADQGVLMACALDLSLAKELGLVDSLGNDVPFKGVSTVVKKDSLPGVRDGSEVLAKRDARNEVTAEEKHIDITMPVHFPDEKAWALDKPLAYKFGLVDSPDKTTVDHSNVLDTVEIKADLSPKVQDRSKVLSEREARKQAKQAAKKITIKGSQSKASEEKRTDATDGEVKVPIHANARSLDKPLPGEFIVVNSSGKTSPVRDDPNIQPSLDVQDKSKVLAEREARKEMKSVGKLQKKHPASSGDSVVKEGLSFLRTLSGKIEENEITGPATEKSKAELRAERRAKQEAQRAAKTADKQQKAARKDDAKENKKPPLAAVKGGTAAVVEKSVTKKKELKKEKKAEPAMSSLRLFSHLHHKTVPPVMLATSNIHPAIVELGVKYASRVVFGSNARCVAFLQALKQLINDYTTPREKDFARGLETQLGLCTSYLDKCRPVSVSMTNALRHLKNHLTQLPNNIQDDEARAKLCDVIDTFIKDQIYKAGDAISKSVNEKIATGDVILIYSCSSLLYQILVESHKEGTNFSVIVVDSAPWFEGREMVRRLVSAGLRCTYVLINAISFIMRQATKVLVGAHALLANGYVMSRAGCAMVALVARSYNVPVLVCCETYKFCERVQTDAFVFNELGAAEDMAPPSSRLSQHHNLACLSPLSIMYDVTPPDLVTAVVTEVTILPCTSVPVILRIALSEIPS